MDPRENEEHPRIHEQGLIHDIEHYVRANGIESEVGIKPNNATVEAEKRALEEIKYQDTIHKQIFGDELHESDRVSTIASFENINIIIETSDGKRLPLPLKVLAQKCETIFRLATFRSNSGAGKKDLELSLAQFDNEAVTEMISLLLDNDQAVENIPSSSIVECCRISHFLQSQEILDEIVAIIDRSIDSENCVSICFLADTLNLTSLFESALSKITSNFDKIENNEFWEDFPRELQQRVLTMRNAVSSSLLARGQRSKVFFTSSDEFLAIMSDNIRDQRERLVDAKQRQVDIINERKKRERVGFLVGRDVHSGSILDAARKIERQEKRVKTLEGFYSDQKKIFSNAMGFANEKSKNQLVL